jgi:hypothetical protein
MIFLLPPKYRYLYWSFTVSILALVLMGLILMFVNAGDWGAVLLLGVIEVILIFAVRYLWRRYRTAQPEEPYYIPNNNK